MLKIQKDVKVHFIGIGGIGMSGIAEILLSQGLHVSGSDLVDSPRVENLRRRGAKINLGHDKSFVADATVVVYSSAIGKDNPEIRAAEKKKIPLMKRAEMLAELMRLKWGLAIAGTHGKTTTTSFLATILQESEFGPTYIIGGIVHNLNGHAKVGGGDFLVVEADESDGSFLLLNPIMSVITNIDHDHMDFYKSEKELLAAFDSFANKIPFYGCCALNAHDKELMKIKSKMKRPYLTFGIEGHPHSSPHPIDFEAKNIKSFVNKTEFDLYYKGQFAMVMTIRLPGKHNVLNALGAITLAYNMKISFSQIAHSIKNFKGVGRRLEVLFNNGQWEVIDDYAHHPTEISKTLETIRETRRDSKIIVVFEPHRFGRTKHCWDAFLHCFNHADKLFLGPIYPAREEAIPGIDSKRLANDINRLHPGLARELDHLDDFPSPSNYPGKVTIVALGAGSIGKKVRNFVKSLS